METEDEMGTGLKDLLGTEMFEATVEGNRVTTKDVRVWVFDQDGMTFGSGWHSGHDGPGVERSAQRSFMHGD